MNEGTTIPDSNLDSEMRVSDGPALPETKHRVQLDFSAEAYDQLLRIKRKSGAQTNSELIRSAVRVYDWLLSRQNEGWQVELSRGGERVTVALVR